MRFVLADFALWATAAEQALGFDYGDFLTAYTGNRQAANDLALEASPVAAAVRSLLDDKGAFTGTATDLLDELRQRVDEKTQKQRSFPKAPHTLSGHLKRIAPNLRNAGLTVDFDRNERNRLIRLGTQKSVRSVRSVIPDAPLTLNDTKNSSCVTEASSSTPDVTQSHVKVNRQQDHLPDAPDASDADSRTHSENGQAEEEATRTA